MSNVIPGRVARRMRRERPAYRKLHALDLHFTLHAGTAHGSVSQRGPAPKRKSEKQTCLDSENLLFGLNIARK
jgi:hypothetical protein